MFVVYILLAIVILMAMITIHEFGHYIAGKLLNFKINEFAIGFGPKIFSKKRKNGEVFSLRILPIGGFCAFEDEGEIVSGGANGQNADSEPKPKTYNKKGVEQKAFNDQPPWKRMIVLAAGAILNLLSAVIFSLIFISVVGYSMSTVEATFHSVNSAELQQKDKIVAVNGKEIGIMNSLEDLMKKIDKDEDFVLSVERGGKIQTLNLKKTEYRFVFLSKDFLTQDDEGNEFAKLKKDDIVLSVDGEGIPIDKSFATIMVADDSTKSVQILRYDTETLENVFLTVDITIDEYKLFKNDVTEEKTIGIGITTSKQYKQPGFGYALLYCVPFTAKLSWSILGFFGQLITGQIPILGSISGPVTTVTAFAGYAEQNPLNILIFLPLIAANLGVFNLLPVPALDGSKIIFCAIEWIRKKPLNRNVEAWIHFGGLILILGIVLVVEILNLVLL